MRVAVVDIGTNSTRLLIADVNQADRSVDELVRYSVVTRLGERVDVMGKLSEQAIERVLSTLDDYQQAIETYGCEANLAVLTSAVRDAENGGAFRELVRERYRSDARTLSGDEEAQMTFLGAMSDHQDAREETAVVIDIGGGSTEFVVGRREQASFHTSLQAGVVRMAERYIHSDPPGAEEIERLAAEARSLFKSGLPAASRVGVARGIAVAGTATSAASIAQELDPYDRKRVHGYVLSRATVQSLLDRLASLDERGRREVVGLHPDRAPTIIPGMILLREAMEAFDLDQVEVSEHDILRGGALLLAGAA